MFGPLFGTHGNPIVFLKGDKTTVLFTSNHDEGKYNIYQMTSSPFERAKTEKVKGANTRGFGHVSAKGKHYLLFRGAIHELKGSKADKIDISHIFRRQLKAEFEQMYYETWANMGENFYNETFHGVDWNKMRDKYATYLPKVNSRDNLRRVLNDLLGELNTSHFGFYSNGKEESIYYGTRTMATGIDFDSKNPYQVAGIVKNTPVDRKGISIKKGDELVAVNGQKVDKSQNRESYFTQPSMDKEMALTFKGSAGEYTVKLHPTYYNSINNSRYNAWMADCQKRVDEKSNKRIAYVHMKNMGGGELQHFKEEMVSEGFQRDAIILDLRYNTGGNVHDEVLQFLSQRPYLNWKYREGQNATQPNFAPSGKPIVLLINEQSLSDAEMTSAGFKALGLGKIIGMETYRWIVFTSGKGLVDGSFYRLPAWGCYTLDGKNLEQTGVAPDIELNNNFVDRIEGNDPQLDKAIEEILKELK
jgi:tricorn protease